MKNYLKVCGAGFLISLLGALPLGTLNITAFDIAASQGVQNALVFAIAALSVELAYVRLTLWGSEKMVVEEKWLMILLPLGALVLLYLAITNFMQSSTATSMATAPVFLTKLSSPLVLGILLSALNPLQVPFWLTWNKVLASKNILNKKGNSYTLYILGIGLGTFLALLLFIFLGSTLIGNDQVYHKWSNMILGILYLGFSGYLLFLLYKKRLKFKLQ